LTEGDLRVACLANFALVRGVDRLLDVAAVLRVRNRTDIRFIVGGTMALSPSLPGDLGRTGARGETLADVAASRGLAPWFQFLGHVATPESVLTACHALIRPSREDNAWGRDVIEAQAASLPIVAAGQRDTFVKDGVTGILLPSSTAAL